MPERHGRRQSLGLLAGLALAPALARPAGPAHKALIVYLTRTQNTAVLAQIIQARTGAQLCRIEPALPYSANYQENVRQVARQNESGLLPALAWVPDIGACSAVFIGFPTWGMQLPPPIKTLLASQTFAGKTLLPFNSHAGFGLGASMAQLRAYCPRSRIGAALSIVGGHEKQGIGLALTGEKRLAAERSVDEWLAQTYFAQDLAQRPS